MMFRTFARHILWGFLAAVPAVSALAQDLPAERYNWYTPYSPPCTKREDVFDFAKKPTTKLVAKDKYEITFAAKGSCDATVSIIDENGMVVRHLASGVLGANAPAPFKKNSLEQTIYWNGKDDLHVYVREPEKLKVRVSLGLQPTFEKLIADSGPKNLPGFVWAVVVGPDAAFVFTRSPGTGHKAVRKFTRDGNYAAALTPPPANMPMSRCAGLIQVEYEPEKYALHGFSFGQNMGTVDDRGLVLPGTEGYRGTYARPVLVGTRLYWTSGGPVEPGGKGPSMLYWINTDGSTDADGILGVPLAEGLHHQAPRLAASPDGKRLYATHLQYLQASWSTPLVIVKPLGTPDLAQKFAGDPKKSGSDNAHFNTPMDIDCGPKSNVYVADHYNNRVQIFTPDGKHSGTIQVKNPVRVRVHRKTGDVYVLCKGQESGRAVPQIVKFSAANGFKEVFRQKLWPALVMELDSYSKAPRLWLASGEVNWAGPWGQVRKRGYRQALEIWEEKGGKFVKIADFDEEAKRAGGKSHIGRWQGNAVGNGGKLVCDPTRNKLYFDSRVFDLDTGAYLGTFRTSPSMTWNDIAFDKKGYMHLHLHPNHPFPGVGRVDPGAAAKEAPLVYPEVPYDYGIVKKPLTGILNTRCQGGACGFQDGIGVNMQGDIAVPSNIYYIPRMEKEAYQYFSTGRSNWGALEQLGGYSGWMRSIKEKEKRGEEVYFIRRSPGLTLSGGTVWTFDRTGELRKECAVIAGDLINGAMIDEDLCVSFVNARPRVMEKDYFLYDKGSRVGMPETKGKLHPFTGTLIKTKPDTQCRILRAGAPVPLKDVPSRLPDLIHGDYPHTNPRSKSAMCWVEGAAWLYAGACPIPKVGCQCSSQRHHVDWWKRVYVPEAYRHSIGILDANGNLIMHLGRYGNYDSAAGPKSRIPVGEDGIAVFNPHYVTGTDDRLVFSSWGTWITCLKLGYHMEETVSIEER